MMWVEIAVVLIAVGAVLLLWHAFGSPEPARPLVPAHSPKPAPAAAGRVATAQAPTPKPASVRPPPKKVDPLGNIPSLHDEEPTEVTQVHALAPAPQVTHAAAISVHSDGADVDEPTAIHALILVTASAQTDTGRRRRSNEDSYHVLEEKGLFVVADGMGGHLAGEVASQLAVQVIADCYRTGEFPGDANPELPSRADELLRSVQAANEAIHRRGTSDGSLTGMGTTVVAARFSPTKRRAYIAHVGDSRCYRIRQGQIEQLTTDHTLGAITGAGGVIGERLTRALGLNPTVEVDLQLDAPQPSDLYLLCSDGLTKLVPAEIIRDIALGTSDLAEGSRRLIAAANDHGGTDNVTVILVRVDPLTSAG